MPEFYRRLLAHPRLPVRASTLFLSGLTLTLLLAGLSALLLPVGCLRDLNPLLRWSLSPSPLWGGVQIFCYNLLPTLLILVSNLFAASGKRSEYCLPSGYAVLLTLFALYGLLTGTWSFQMAETPLPFVQRILRMFRPWEASGLAELGAYTLIAAATSGIAIVKTRSGITTVSRLRDIRLTGGEALTLLLGLLLLLSAALLESTGIHRL